MVTETIYALAVVRRPRIIPKRVYIVTTEDAYPAIVSALMGRKGAIQRLASEHDLPRSSLQCSLQDVMVLHSAAGRPLSDIRSSADSRDAGEAIAAALARLHADPDAELHCSLAGGRKTMGALLALALQVSARPGDRLYHVLVNEPFERIPDFFYPPRRPVFYQVDGERVDSRSARVDIAEIPLVRMGAVAEFLGLEAGDLMRKAAQIEAAMQRCITPVRLALDVHSCLVRLNGVQIRPQPQQFALLTLYAMLRGNCGSCRGPGCVCPECHPPDDDVFERRRELLLRIHGTCRKAAGQKFIQMMSDLSGSADSREEFCVWLRQTRSKLNRFLRLHLPPGASASLLVTRARIPGTANSNGHGMRIAPSRISIGNVGVGSGNVELEEVFTRRR